MHHGARGRVGAPGHNRRIRTLRADHRILQDANILRARLLPVLSVSALRISAAVRRVAVAAIAVSRVTRCAADLLWLLLANWFVLRRGAEREHRAQRLTS